MTNKRKNRTMTMLVVIMVIGSTSCSKSKPAETKSVPETQIEITSEQTASIFNAYLGIKDALVETNGELASEAAKELFQLSKSGDQLIKKINNDAERISENSDTKLQRDYFNTLSQNVYALLKSSGSTESTVYRQYCPMAFNNTGAFWLSAEDEILNPYFGDQMLTCGSSKKAVMSEQAELSEQAILDGPFLDQIKLSSLDDEEAVNNETFQNKILILNLWATWCKPCIKEMPDLEIMMAQLSEDFELVLSSDEDLEKIKSFTESRPMNMNFVKLENSIESLGVYALPTTFIIGKNGELLETVVGARDWKSPETIEKLKQITQ